MFCFFPANFMSSTYTEKNNLFSRCTKRHSQFGICPSHVSIGFSQIAFPIIVLPRDDRTDSVQEEQRGLPYWTMIWAICVVVDESKCPGHSDFWIFQFVSIFNFYLGISKYCNSCLPCASLQSGNDIHDLGGCHLRC